MEKMLVLDYTHNYFETKKKKEKSAGIKENISVL